MREYLEQQLKKKAHELVMMVFKTTSKIKGNKGPTVSLRKIIGKVPVSIFEAQSRDFNEDKLRYFTEARNSVFESKYYLDLLYTEGSISYYAFKNVSSKIELLDKMLVSRIRAIDKRKAKAEYKTSIRTNYS